MRFLRFKTIVGWPKEFYPFHGGLAYAGGPNEHGVFRVEWVDPVLQMYDELLNLEVGLDPHHENWSDNEFEMVKPIEIVKERLCGTLY